MRNSYGFQDLGAEMAKVFMGGSSSVEKDSYNKTLGSLMKAESQRASARKNNSDAALNESRLSNQESGRKNFLSATTGLNLDKIGELMSAVASGFPQGEAAGPPTEQGEVPTIEQRPEWFTGDVENKFNRGREALALNDVATGDTNGLQIAKALQQIATTGRQDQALSGELDVNKLGAVMAATAGKPLVNVTGSGIAYDNFGDKNDLNTAPFDTANAVKAKATTDSATIRAKATVDAVLERNKVNGSKLPAEAKLIDYYINELNYTREQAVELAKSKKNTSLRDMAADIYLQQLENISFNFPDLSEQEVELRAQKSTNSAIDFLKTNEDSFSSDSNGASGNQGGDKPPTPGAKKAPDGFWYIQKNDKWFKVE